MTPPAGNSATAWLATERPTALSGGGEAWVTIHPSYLLRIDDEAATAREYERFVQDLMGAREHAEAAG